MSERYDAVVIGAGILGLAHATHLMRAGKRVLVVERGASAQGASVRNFGMVWPIGQPPGQMREIALRSREIWLEVLRESGLWHRECGSLTLAYHADELSVLEEFSQKGTAFGYETELLSPAHTLKRCSAIRPDQLQGALWSPSELCVFPRQIVAELPVWLRSKGVKFRFSTAATEVGTGYVVAGGTRIEAEQIYICTGDDFETLYPALFAASGLTRSKLQMMRARRANQTRLGVHLCAGLTLGHYPNFRICDRLPALLERFRGEMPDYEKWGIHLLVSEHEDGSLTIGDSHEYGLEVTPFTRSDIDRLILDYLDTFLPTQDLEIIERWYGVYAKHASKPFIHEKPDPGVDVVTGVGGAGMTLSFGLAESVVRGTL